MSFDFDLFILLSAFIGSTLIGVLTLYKNPRSHTNVLFFLFTLALGIYLFINYAALVQVTDEATLFWIRTVLGVALIINFSFFLLTISFPRNKIKISRALFWIATTSTFILIPFTQTDLMFSSLTPGTTQPVPNWGMGLFVLHSILFLGGGIYVLFRKLKSFQGVEKQQIKIFVIGALFMFSAILFSNLFLVIFLKTTAFASLLPVYILIFVSFIGYAILRHRFLDIGAIVARSVTYAIVILIVAILYSSYLFIVSRFLFAISFTVEQQMALGALTVFLLFTFPFLRNFVEKITDEIFYKDKYDSDSLLQSLTVIMASTIELDVMVHQIISKICTEVKINHGAVFFFEHYRVSNVMQEGYKEMPTIDEYKLSRLLSANSTLILDEIDDSERASIMREYSIKVALPLRTEGGVIGILVFGDKLSGDIYSSEDIQMLEILGPEMAIAIKNALSYSEIRRFSVTLQQEVEKATKDLRVANEKLKQLDRMKDEFVSLASHELRTPMTAIKSYLWMAISGKGGVLSEKQQYYLNRAFSSTDRLIKLVNDMLNISRIESGRITIELSKVDMIQLTKDVIAEVMPRAQELGINIDLKADDRIPFVLADTDKIKEGLINLIGNSLKFTPKNGNITVSFAVSGMYVATSVSDTGAGIEPSDLPKLFQKFALLPGSYTINQNVSQGTGLGLYICKSIVELLHGSISAVSAGVRKGSTFTFTLPIFTSADEALIVVKNENKSTLGLEHAKI